MPTFKKTDEFDAWHKRLDKSPRIAIVERILHAESGILGKPMKGTGGICEIVMDTGPGYRLYYCRETSAIYWLLMGGIKKDQTQDLKRAQSLRAELERSGYGKAD